MDVAIIGGGIAGLTAAYTAQQAGLRYTLLEAGARWGGKAHTERVDGFAVEYGPDSFITRKPWALELVQALGVPYISVNPLPERIYVLSRGEMHPLPDGLHLLVPSKVGAFLQSGLFSPWGKVRALMEPFVPPRRDDTDETLAQFVRRRLGAEALDKLGEPMLAGVYNADAEQQSMLATFPQFRAIERKHGSLLRGMSNRQPAAPSEVPPLIALRDGTGALPDALVNALGGDCRLNAPVTAISRTADGYQVVAGDETVTARALIVTSGANVAARLLTDVAPDAAKSLAEIRYEGVGSMSLAFRREDVPHPLDAYGLVIPSSERRQIDGITFASSKWANRAPEDHTLIRVFFGGPHTRYMLDADDETLHNVILTELHDLLGIEAEPLFTRMCRWRDAYPQYDLGHRERVAAAFAALPDDMALAGNAYGGIGVPDTIRTAQEAVRRVGALMANMA